MPAVVFSQKPGNNLAKERADIDPHVKDRKSCVAARPTFGIKVADYG